MNHPRTMFQKIWESHVVAQREDGEALFYIDRQFLNEGPFYAFDGLRSEGHTVRRPLKQIGFADHYMPTLNRNQGVAGITDPEMRRMVDQLQKNSLEFGIPFVGVENPRQGIMHVVGPDLGIVHPGMTITASDSHTTTNGAFGAFAFGIGASEVKHVLATQTLWYRRPGTMRINVDGRLPIGVSAKDVILAIIAKIGDRGGLGHVIEYTGSAIRNMTMEQRMTLCNMSIESGARSGLVAPDDVTYAFLERCEMSPKGDQWPKALAQWHALVTEPGATFDRCAELNAADIEPMVTWGTASDDALPISGRIPDPSDASTAEERMHLQSALRYMGLEPGILLTEISIDRVFIGSCTNSRLSDLEAAALVVKGRKARIPAMISPGSTEVKRQAEARGLDKIFLAAGFEWRDSACSMCVGSNGDFAAPGERCASTSPRNFENRQGRGARTHLVSAPMAAAAAITGKLTDVRNFS